MLRVWSVSGQPVCTTAEELDDVRALKQQLRWVHGFPLCLQQLMHEGHRLDDTAKLTLHSPWESFFSFCSYKTQGGIKLGIVFYFCSYKTQGVIKQILFSEYRTAPMDLQLVLSAIADAEQKREASDELINFAASTGNVEAARFLLKAGIQEACSRERGHTEAERLLGNAGADIMALVRACENGHAEVARLLIQAGADKDARVDFQRRSALVCACGNGHIDVAQLLLEAGADKDVQVASGRTALICACRNGHAEVARLLLEAGVVKDVQDISGKTALLYACEHGQVDSARLMMDHN